jgi:hypothetical protein
MLVAFPGSAGALTIRPVFDGSITSRSDAAQIEAAFNSVATEFDRRLSSPAIVSIAVSWGGVGGSAIPLGVVGASRDNLYDGLSFTQIRRYLSASAARNPLDAAFAAAVKTLPTAAPAGVDSYSLPSAQAKALGLIAGNQAGYDGYVGFSSNYAYSFSGTAPLQGAYDFQAVAAHEIDEVLGRITGLDGSSPSYRSVFDLYRYAAHDKLSFAYGSTAYLSFNAGATSLGSFNTVGAGDRSDWKAGVADAQLAYLSPGLIAPLGTVDWKVLDALGWNQGRSVFLSGAAAAPTLGEADFALAAPEPQSWTMMLTGLGLGGLVIRRRRDATTALTKKI